MSNFASALYPFFTEHLNLIIYSTKAKAMKKITVLLSALCMAAMMPATSQAQGQFKLVEQSLNDPDNTPLPVFPVPSERQVKWNET